MKRAAICVDAGYLYAQGSASITGTVKPRSSLSIDPPKVLSALCAVVEKHAAGCPLLRCYWYDGHIASKGPTLDQEQIANLDNIKLRLGFINSAGQQKGVDSLIVTDLIELARLGAICDAVLVSGDEDVRVGVQIAQNYGVRVHLIGIAATAGRNQSKALLQEADTTTVWSTADVAKFLSVREMSPVSTAASSTVSAVASAPSAASATATIEKASLGYADEIDSSDVGKLMTYWETQKGIPPEFDGRLLARNRAELGRDLEMAEKRLARSKFSDAVRERSKETA
jgi:uncharacterized LabA/DUF88 family protein